MAVTRSVDIAEIRQAWIAGGTSPTTVTWTKGDRSTGCEPSVTVATGQPCPDVWTAQFMAVHTIDVEFNAFVTGHC